MTDARATTMAKEIREQPRAVADTLAALVPLRADLRELIGDRRLVFVGRGSSDNACEYGRYLAEVFAQRPASSGAASIATHYRAELDLRDVAVVAVSQSGATAEIVEVEAWARRCGARTVAVSNVADSPLVGNADLALVTRAGPELAVPATKTYTTQAAAMLVLATALAAEPSSLDEYLTEVPPEIERLLELEPPCEALEAFAGSSTWLAVGRGLLAGTAMELGLKLEETCRRPVRALSYADLRHGPVAFVEPGSVALIVGTADSPLVPGLVAIANDLRAKGAITVGLGTGAVVESCDLVIAGTVLPELVAPVAAAVPGQLLIEALARRLGRDPDAPEGLAKVTRTD